MCLKHVETGFTSINNENGKFWVFFFRALPQKGPFAPAPRTHTHTHTHTHHGWCLQRILTISVYQVTSMRHGKGAAKVKTHSCGRICR